MKRLNTFLLLIAGLFSSLFAVSASAAIDLSAVDTAFTDLSAGITTVGGLLLGAAVLGLAFRWLKGMLF